MPENPAGSRYGIEVLVLSTKENQVPNAGWRRINRRADRGLPGDARLAITVLTDVKEIPTLGWENQIVREDGACSSRAGTLRDVRNDSGRSNDLPSIEKDLVPASRQTTG